MHERRISHEGKAHVMMYQLRFQLSWPCWPINLVAWGSHGPAWSANKCAALPICHAILHARRPCADAVDIIKQSEAAGCTSSLSRLELIAEASRSRSPAICAAQRSLQRCRTGAMAGNEAERRVARWLAERVLYGCLCGC